MTLTQDFGGHCSGTYVLGVPPAAPASPTTKRGAPPLAGVFVPVPVAVPVDAFVAFAPGVPPVAAEHATIDVPKRTANSGSFRARIFMTSISSGRVWDRSDYLAMG
jgi:hypothetical protein